MRRHKTTSLIGLAVCMLWLLHCELGTPTSQTPAVYATVYGTVSGPEGPVRANVRADAYVGECGGTRFATAEASSDGEGYYRFRMGSFGTPFDACVGVRASAAGLQSRTVTGTEVRFRKEDFDSVRVDIELEPAP